MHICHHICRILLLAYNISTCLAFAEEEGDSTQLLSNSTSPAATSLDDGESPFLPKAPNFITCNPFYGTELHEESCRQLAGDIFPGQQQTVFFYEWNRPFQLPRYKVPIIFDEPEGNSIVFALLSLSPIFGGAIGLIRFPDYPGCIITVDLAGKSSWSEPVAVSSEAIISTAKSIVDRCVIDSGKRQGGFGTARFTRTAKGMAEAVPGVAGYGLCRPRFID